MATPADRNGGQGDGQLFPELQLGLPEDGLAQEIRSPQGLAEWVGYIRDREMPALGATVALIHSVTDDEKSPTGKLAQAILQDAAMTAKVLKLANSALYNPNQRGVSTISRAIVVLGFNAVAEIAIAIRVIDSLLGGGVRARVVSEMARVFHAAVQARSLAALRHDGRSEEVFIAALLSRVGDMAFWCFGGSQAERLDEALGSTEKSVDETQVAVLGFRLRQLSLGLAREWRLGPLLQSVLEGSARPSVAEWAIHSGLRLAVELENGWDTPAASALIDGIAISCGVPQEILRDALVANSAEAARIAAYFGADEAGDLIPLPADDKPQVVEAAAEAAEASREPDPQLQLRILREISGRISAGASLNEILQLVLEGIYRGVGFDRVLFGLLSPNRVQLVGKTALGVGAEALRQAFIFSLDESPHDIFNEFFRSPRSLRLEPGRPPQGLRLDRLQLVTGNMPGCIAPILVQGRAIGLFYADRLDLRRSIDDETFDAFQLFAQQVSLAVTASSASRHNP